jgi:hypothetical protein
MAGLAHLGALGNPLPHVGVRDRGVGGRGGTGDDSHDSSNRERARRARADRFCDSTAFAPGRRRARRRNAERPALPSESVAGAACMLRSTGLRGQDEVEVEDEASACKFEKTLRD